MLSTSRPPLQQLLVLLTLMGLAVPGGTHDGPVVKFHNHFDQPLLLHFVHGDGKLELKGRIPPGQVVSQDTFKGHVFAIAAEAAGDGGGAPPRHNIRVGRSDDVTCTGVASGSGRMECKAKWAEDVYSGPKWDAHASKHRTACRLPLAKDHSADAKHFCEQDWSQRFLAQCDFDMTPKEFQKEWEPFFQEGVEMLRAQPQTFRNFTDVGFAVQDIPEDLLQELRDFWLAGRLERSLPENPLKLDPALPGCQSDTWMLDVSPELKGKLNDAIRPLLASWTGLDPAHLKPTAIYGLRLYREGSMLQMHVDRRKTHALSAILEIGHLGYGFPDADIARSDPWPLRILAHDGVEHQVPNRAGQLILYESATCPHGRPDPFPGREFANIFVHFAPQDWPSAYTVTPRQGDEL